MFTFIYVQAVVRLVLAEKITENIENLLIASVIPAFIDLLLLVILLTTFVN